MDYLEWSQEYILEARKVLKAIEHKKKKLSTASLDEQHEINAEIICLRNIYYECMLTAKHLSQRAGVKLDAA